MEQLDIEKLKDGLVEVEGGNIVLDTAFRPTRRFGFKIDVEKASDLEAMWGADKAEEFVKNELWRLLKKCCH